MLAGPPVITTGYPQYPPLEQGQHTMPPVVTPGTEIIIAVMGVTGKLQVYLKPAYIG